jgi:5'-AMP-activated protein kinase regulatory beta subunit
MHGIDEEDKEKIKDGNLEKDEKIFFKEKYSSYKVIDTDISNSKSFFNNSISNDTTNVVSINEKVESQEIKIRTYFEWKSGGNTVYVTGSFSNWSERYLMTKNNSTGKFELILYLNKGFHEYKFIVDDKWSYSNYLPICTDDKGNINNIIETTNLNEKNFKLNENITVEEVKNDNNSDYNNYKPSITEMNLDARNLPHNYHNSFNIDINSKQDHIGNSSFFKSSCRRDYNENNSFKSIPIGAHENL